MMSRSDIYMNEWRVSLTKRLIRLNEFLISKKRKLQDESMSEVGLTVAVRGVMVSNENPASGWIPVKGQKKFNER